MVIVDPDKSPEKEGAPQPMKLDFVYTDRPKEEKKPETEKVSAEK